MDYNNDIYDGFGECFEEPEKKKSEDDSWYDSQFENKEEENTKEKSYFEKRISSQRISEKDLERILEITEE